MAKMKRFCGLCNEKGPIAGTKSGNFRYDNIYTFIYNSLSSTFILKKDKLTFSYDFTLLTFFLKWIFLLKYALNNINGAIQNCSRECKL